jgi:acetyl-CoA acetyltransferase
MASFLTDKTAIVGIGETPYTRDCGISSLRLALQAGAAAIEDAGLAPKDIDGLVTAGTPRPVFAWPTMDDFKDNFGMKDVKYTSVIQMGGAANCAAILHAAMAVATGQCNYVLGFYGWKGGSEMRISDMARRAPQAARIDGSNALTAPYGILTPGPLFAPHVLRYIHNYGDITPALATVTVTDRKHALLNPKAFMKTPLTIEDYMNSPMLIYPIRRLDFSLQTDGACAFVVTSAERARDMKHRPVYIMGAAEGHPDSSTFFASRPRLTHHGMEKCADRCFAMAGVTPKDMDFAEIYDGFSYVIILQLETIFCGKGEAVDFVKDGKIELGGKLPINTHGGLLSEAHIWGWNHINEAVRQLRGDCGNRQVKDAEIGLVTGFGDLFDASIAILRR